ALPSPRAVPPQRPGAHGNAGHHRRAPEPRGHTFMRHRNNLRPSGQDAVRHARIQILLLDHQRNLQDCRGRPDRRGRIAPRAAPRDHDAHQRSPTDGNGGTGERGNAEIRQTTHVPSIRLPVWSAQRIPMFPRSRDPALRPEPAKPAWGLPQYCEMFSTIPIPIIAKSSDDPPKLTNGSGTPVMGRTPVVTPMLMMACRT